MTNNELAIKLLELIETDNPQLKAVLEAVRIVLSSPDVKSKPAAKQTAGDKPKSKGGRKPSIDWGKAKACRAAGWSIEKIADELRCSPATVRNKFRELGID